MNNKLNYFKSVNNLTKNQKRYIPLFDLFKPIKVDKYDELINYKNLEKEYVKVK